MQTRELTIDEIESVSGGVIYIPIALAVRIIVYAAAGGFTAGVVRATRDNRNN